MCKCKRYVCRAISQNDMPVRMPIPYARQLKDIIYDLAPHTLYHNPPTTCTETGGGVFEDLAKAQIISSWDATIAATSGLRVTTYRRLRKSLQC